MQAASKFRPQGPISLAVLWDQAGENLHHHTFCNYYSSDISAWARTHTQHTKRAGQKPPLYTEMLREGRTVKVLRFAHSTPLWTKTVPGGSSKNAAVWVNTRFFRRRQNREDGKAGALCKEGFKYATRSVSELNPGTKRARAQRAQKYLIRSGGPLSPSPHPH